MFKYKKFLPGFVPDIKVMFCPVVSCPEDLGADSKCC